MLNILSPLSPPRRPRGFVAAAVVIALGAFHGPAFGVPSKHIVVAQRAKPPAHIAAAPPVLGFPRDAGPHDAASVIEWWYFNSFFQTAHGRHYAVIGAFFRTGLSAKSKGHYLIYALADLDARTREPFSILDPAEIDLLRSYAALQSVQRPDDPRPLQLLALLQRGELPAPHRVAPLDALVETTPTFSIGFDNNSLAQQDATGRSWKANLNGAEWSLELNLDQPTRPAMLVGGSGHTGLRRANDMQYVSLTRMAAHGTLTIGGQVDEVTGVGWLDRQWGTSWGVGDNGWDWFGFQLDDGSDIIVYRVRDNKTGKVLRSDATLLSKEGMQTVETAPVMTPSGSAQVIPTSGGEAGSAQATPFTDPETSITFPQSWTISLPKMGLTLTTNAAFPQQTMPVVGIGDAIWEGVVRVSGTHAGKPVSGRGYMELVGYKPMPVASPAKTRTSSAAVGAIGPTRP